METVVREVVSDADQREDTGVLKIPGDLLRWMKVIAIHEGETMFNVADRFLRPLLLRRYREVVAEMNEQFQSENAGI